MKKKIAKKNFSSDLLFAWLLFKLNTTTKMLMMCLFVKFAKNNHYGI